SVVRSMVIRRSSAQNGKRRGPWPATRSFCSCTVPLLVGPERPRASLGKTDEWRGIGRVRAEVPGPGNGGEVFPRARGRCGLTLGEEGTPVAAVGIEPLCLRVRVEDAEERCGVRPAPR